jgi:glycosyltransferase involved in cell wall biosynthesis
VNDPPTAGGSVVLDMRPAQSSHSSRRGIGRYCAGVATALGAAHSQLVGSVLVDRGDLPPLPDSLRGKTTTDPDWSRAGVLHVQSPFEPDTTAVGTWPREASRAGTKLVVTVYDLIPDVLADPYLADPGFRRRYAARRELVRVADHVVTLSESTRSDVVSYWGIESDRVTVVGAAPDPLFTPGDRTAAAARAAAEVAGLHGPYLLCTSPYEHRKNVERLVDAYAALPAGVRERWQLVLVCRLGPLQRNHLEVAARRLGIEGRLVLAGAVEDATLLALVRAADLAVMPSLYEGYGLPVVEAQACRTPAVCAATSSMVELVPPEATFDPLDVAAMAAALDAGLTDPARRRVLEEWAAAPAPRWADVSDRLAGAYRQVLDAPEPPRRPPRPRVALLVGEAGIRREAAEAAAAALAPAADVDVFAGPGSAWGGTPGVVADLAAAPSWDRVLGGYRLAVTDLGPGEGDAVVEHFRAARVPLVVAGSGVVEALRQGPVNGTGSAPAHVSQT